MITIAAIQSAVATHYRLPLRVMRADPTRSYQHSRPRHIAMFLARRLTKHSDRRIGMSFQRDRATVRYAASAVERRLRIDPAMSVTLEAIADELLRQEIGA
jgi:chromosomal replication initiation ATPase DnaA